MMVWEGLRSWNGREKSDDDGLWGPNSSYIPKWYSISQLEAIIPWYGELPQSNRQQLPIISAGIVGC